MKRMKLLTEQIRRALPAIYSQDDHGKNAIVYAKYFTPDAQYTWFILEGEPAPDIAGDVTDFEFYGIIIGHEIEYGYFRLSQLEAIRGRLGLPVERDLHCGTPCPAYNFPELKSYFDDKTLEKTLL